MSNTWDTTTADSNGNFSVELPHQLTNGQITLYVEVIDLAGNTSPPSSPLTVTIVSVASDYNGDSYSDPALYVATQQRIKDNGLFKQPRRR